MKYAKILLILTAFYLVADHLELTEEDKRYNERMLKLRQEVQRPIIQAKLEKQENGPIDLDTIATGKVTWISEDGKVKDLFNINVNLKIK